MLKDCRGDSSECSLDVNYEERLDRWGLFHLEQKKLMDDLKIYEVDNGIIFPMVDVCKTIGHRFNIIGRSFQNDLKGNITQRVVII